MNDAEIDAGVLRIFKILALRDENPLALLAFIKREQTAAETRLRKMLLSKPADDKTWAEFQMQQGRYDALNDLGNKLRTLVEPTPDAPRRPALDG